MTLEKDEIVENEVVDGEIVPVKTKTPIKEDEAGVVVDDDVVIVDGDEDADKKVLEDWQKTEGELDLANVPVKTHVAMKQKLKGRIKDGASEIETLKAEIEALKRPKAPVQDTAVKSIKRPRPEEFDNDDEYEAALDKFDDAKAMDRYNRVQLQSKQANQYNDAQAILKQNVDDHYERAAKLVKESGIKPEIYQQTDLIFRNAIEKIRPGQGDLIADQLINVMGEGSEKVQYFLGRNTNALNQLTALLIEDPGGVKAAIYLGTQKERLTKPKKMKSMAPAPGAQNNGGANVSSQEGKIKRDYEAASKKGDGQAMYDLKKKAREAGANTRSW